MDRRRALRTGILDLPEELLLTFGEYLDIATLFLLLQTNRKLHRTFLSVCLARFQIKNPEKHVKITLGEARCKIDVVSVLNLAFHVKSVQHLTCKFVIPGHDIAIIFHSARRLDGWIRRLESVKSVVLAFDTSLCGCCKTPLFKDTWVAQWSADMTGLMNTLLAKSTESIKLKGGRILSHLFVYRYSKPSSSSSLSKASSKKSLVTIKHLFTGRKERKVDPCKSSKEPVSVLKGENWEFRRTKDGDDEPLLPELVPRAKDHSKLRNLNIQSIMFLMPPLLQWTISSIQYSSLRRLTLKDLSINSKCWVALFNLISSASTSISELVLAKLCQIMPKDLLDFLSRLPALTALHIDGDVGLLSEYEPLHFPDFPKLVTLHAPGRWTNSLLASQARGLESLEALTIAYKLRKDGFSQWMEPPQSSTLPSLIVAQRRPLTIAVEVVLGSSPGWRMFEDLNMVQNEGRVNPDIQLISSMTLVVNCDFAKEDMRLWSVLPKWLGLFKGLRHLSVVGRNAVVDGDGEAAMLEVVTATGLRLLTLEVNGKETQFPGKSGTSARSS